MGKEQIEKMPTNCFGGFIFFWQIGNTKRANTNLDDKFNIIDKNANCAKKLTYFKFGVSEKFYNKSLVHYTDLYGDAFSIMPDGTTFDDFLGDKLREPYKDAKFVPLTEQEMQYIKSKLLIPAKAENIIEWRSYFMNQVTCNLEAYYYDTDKNEILSLWFDTYSIKFLPEENVYLIQLDSNSPDVILSNKIYPVSKEEILPLKERYKVIDTETLTEANKFNLDIPLLISEYYDKEFMQEEQKDEL